MDKNRNFGIITSCLLHICIVISIFIFKDNPSLVPSKSNGISVDLISYTQLTQTPPPQMIRSQAAQYVITNNHADITLKQREILKHPANTQVSPVISKHKIATSKTVPHAIPLKLSKNKINNLLNGLIPNANNNHPVNTSGVASGGSNLGSSDINNTINTYADSVINLIRPFVIIPNNIDPNTQIIIQVILLPNMTVFTTQILQASSNSTYDDNVLQAINKVHIFPSLPQGSNFNDFRVLKLIFKPS